MNILPLLGDQGMLAQPYMQNALLSGTAVAILAGLVGVFVVLRGVTFAAHALAHVGFAGAAGAVLVSIDPLWGLVVFALGGAVSLGVLGAREGRHDASTALVLVAMLGLGALFLTLNATYATAAFTLLFGTIVGVSRAQMGETLLLAVGCVLALGILYRPLLMIALSPDLAAARGVPVRGVNVVFLIIVGIAAAVTVPTVGVLLIFSLMVGPAATAGYLAQRPLAVLVIAVGLDLGVTWGGMIVAYETGWPVGFLISTMTAFLYLCGRLIAIREWGDRRDPSPTH